MKFLPLTTTQKEADALSEEYKAAHQIGKVFLGTNTFFIKKGFKVYYIGFSEIHRAFRRVKAVPTRICCGKGEIRLEYIVLCDKKNEIAEIYLPDERASTAIINELQQKSPSTKIGKKD